MALAMLLFVLPTQTGCAKPAMTTEPASNSGVWKTVFFDDFDGDTLDMAKWRPEVSCWGGGNNERQCYTAQPDNVSVSDGMLRLKAQKETFTGPKYPIGMPGAPGGEVTQAYTSGKVRTRGLSAYRFGRISARLKLPSGQGTWPAFWMLPEDDVYGAWPLSGEIDIMEATNLGTPCDDCATGIEMRTSGALHFGDSPPDNTYFYAMADLNDGVDPTEDWRVYSVEWSLGEIQWFVDGQLFLQLDHEDWYTTSAAANGRPYAPFDQAFYLALNLAVGGTLPGKNGAGFDPSSFPAELLVDWVKVEQCDGDTETGRQCLSESGWTGSPLGPWEDEKQE
jgi:beta-glucanase (GH16 family)